MSARSIAAIAADITKHWPKPYFGAVPYLEAMHLLVAIDDQFYADSARSVVVYFLSNATTWRGDDARRIKAELKALLKGKESKPMEVFLVAYNDDDGPYAAAYSTQALAQAFADEVDGTVIFTGVDDHLVQAASQVEED